MWQPSAATLSRQQLLVILVIPGNLVTLGNVVTIGIIYSNAW